MKQTADDPGSWLTKKPNYPLKKGGGVTFFTAGGGGYGPAKARRCELIERDRRLGYVSGTKANRTILARGLSQLFVLKLS